MPISTDSVEEALSEVLKELHHVKMEIEATVQLRRSLRFLMAIGLSGFLSVMGFLVTTTIRTDERLGTMKETVAEHQHVPSIRNLEFLRAKLDSVGEVMETKLASIEKRLDNIERGRRPRSR